MKVWASCASAAAPQSDQLPGFNLIAFFHLEVREVEIQAEKPLAVIYNDATALEV